MSYAVSYKINRIETCHDPAMRQDHPFALQQFFVAVSERTLQSENSLSSGENPSGVIALPESMQGKGQQSETGNKLCSAFCVPGSRWPKAEALRCRCP